MAIIGLNIKSIEASVDNKAFSGTLSISSTPTITGVKKIETNAPEMKEAIEIGFRLDTSYNTEGKSNKLGQILITGILVVSAESAEEVVQKWRKDKKLEKKLFVEAMNAIFKRCMTESFLIAYSLKLPPPFSLPAIKDDEEYKSKKQKEYIG